MNTTNGIYSTSIYDDKLKWKKQGAVTYRMGHQENKVTKMFILENELSWKATTKSTSLYFRIQTVKSTKHSTHSSI